MRLQLCSATIVLIAALYVTYNSDGTDPARAGMALSYALSSTLICQAVIAVRLRPQTVGSLVRHP
eukprot:SAG22_NODE_44_length_24912_cov_33.648894_21_plen_65_part_00